ncbi:YcgL domain-containing protein [Kangiella taiwanensis]|uniref:YcgL domain-containing protein GCM10023150_22280 n=1 Tax=Kangiella taiwanensis TaxID=1079179 RepID=A0ABP8I8D6_9GAMM|nr:YcgL domain-containing protein [Kangiella taiwanensis]
MMCSVYKSAKKPDTYLYVPYDSDFDDLPEGLTSVWGEPELVMHIDLGQRDKLALVDITELKEKLTEDGYYLQMPPTQEELAGLIEGNSKAPISR